MADSSPLASFAVSSLIHVFILFAVLSALFVLVISKIETDTFNREIDDNLGARLNKALKAQPNAAALRAALRTVDFNLLEQIYSRPSERVRVNNKWLFTVIIIVNVALFILLCTVVAFNHRHVSVGVILVENALGFVIIGAFEYFFFKTVISKYVPVAPSVFQGEVVHQLLRDEKR